MFISQKHVFWQALLITILIFSLGIIMGVVLESWRIGKVDSLLEKTNIDLLDIRLQNQIYKEGFFNCDKAIKENILFADRIFNEAKILDRYETASRLKEEDLAIEHKKYDLLRATLFINSMIIKKQCNSSYYEILYFYKYNDPNIEVKAKQNVFSRLLLEVKERKGNDILLIPIAGNINSSSINLLMDNINITNEDLPVIIINEKIRIDEVINIEEIMRYFR